MNKFEIYPDGSKARRPSDNVCARATVTTHEEITVPEGATHVVLSGSLPFHVAFDADAAVPSDTDDGTACELINPATPIDSRTFIVTGVTSISVAAAASAMVTASFYTT
jgi:hypothetical protein